MGNSESNNIDGSDCSECAEILNNNNIKTLKDFRKWSLSNHPDKGGDADKFAKVSDCTDEYFKQKNCEESLLTTYPIKKHQFYKEDTKYTEPPRYTGPPRYTSKPPPQPTPSPPRYTPSPPKYTERQQYPARNTYFEEFDKKAERERREFEREREKQEREDEAFFRAQREYEQRGFGRERYEREERERQERQNRERMEKERMEKERSQRQRAEKEILEKENKLKQMKIKSNVRKDYVRDDIVKVMTKYADNIYYKYLNTETVKEYIDINRKAVVDACLKMAARVIDKNETFKNFMNGEDIPGINETVILKAIERYIKENINIIIQIAKNKFFEDL